MLSKNRKGEAWRARPWRQQGTPMVLEFLLHHIIVVLRGSNRTPRKPTWRAYEVCEPV